MGSWQLHTCILFYGLVCSHIGIAHSTSPQPGKVLSIVASMVVLCPWSIPRRMEMATLVLCWDICVDGFASLGEQLLPCIHCCYCTLLFMHEHNKLLNLLKCLLWQICCLSTKFKKSQHHCRECSPYISGLQFSFPAKEWDCVTNSESVKSRKSSWFVCNKTWSNRVSCNVSEMFSSPKCNPQLFHLYLFNNTDC